MAAKPVAPLAEFTFKAVAAGVVLGLVFGAANAYIGLKVALTISASIPAAVMTVALFRALGARTTILEANLSQTIASASTSLARGTIFTMPALFMWGVAPPYWQMVALAFLGALLGLAAMIPLRRLLIVQEHGTLAYPEGTACAEVLRAIDSGASGGRWIFTGLAVGALLKAALSIGFLVPGELRGSLPVLPDAVLALELSPALIAIGYVLGYQKSGVIVSGGLIAALVLVPLVSWFGGHAEMPLAPVLDKRIADMSAGELWKSYVRTMGAGAVAAAGLITVARNLPSMWSALRAVTSGLGGGRAGAPGAAGTTAGAVERTDRDLPGTFVLGGVAVVILAATFVPGVLAGELSLVQRLICGAGVAVCGLVFVTVMARIAGLVGVSSQPTSAVALMTLIVVASAFAAAGWKHEGARAAVLTVGALVATAASKAGDISQDLKTGYLVGATPARQQFGQLIGAAFACWGVAATVYLLGREYEFGGAELPAAQATLMKTIVEGVLGGNLPWELVLVGAALTVAVFLCGVPVLAFAIGVYLPLASLTAIFLGGCVRGLVERGRRAGSGAESDPGILAASGLVAGEALMGLAVAALVGGGVIEKAANARIGGVAGEVGTVALLLAVCAFLWRAGRSPGDRATAA
jgi:putative OPT family oligopeptide transporter